MTRQDYHDEVVHSFTIHASNGDDYVTISETGDRCTAEICVGDSNSSYHSVFFTPDQWDALRIMMYKIRLMTPPAKSSSLCDNKNSGLSRTTKDCPF